MASLVYAVWSITNVASVHCALRPEISPCTCEAQYSTNYVELSCEKVDSFHQIVDALSNKFEPYMNVSLRISHSQLEDLEMRAFTDMKINVVKLRMPYNSLRAMPELPFRGLSNVEFLSIGDNELDEIPKHMLNHMPQVKTLDLGRCRVRSILHDDFKGTQYITNLFLAKNNITRLDEDAFPPNLVTLHLGRNQIDSLNGSLRYLNKLESLFINVNNISNLDNELPESNRLKLLIAHNNRLEYLPESMRYMTKIETLHLHYNYIKSINGTLKNAQNLSLLHIFSNEIDMLAHDEFISSVWLEDLDIALNNIKSVNNSLLPLRRLRSANFSYNKIEEFSMNEIRGLLHLRQLDLSNNNIQKLTGRKDNNIEQDSFLVELMLNNNRLKTLDGALMNLNSLQTLNLASNEIDRILPEDFIGLVHLETLDLSYNQLITLKEFGTTFLSSLRVLKAASNKLTRLENDFHGLPILCQANLTNNEISSLSVELVSQTRCMNHNVQGKLDLYLEDNPIMCDEVLNTICPMMSSKHTRIRGKSQCFDSDQEVCTALPMIYPPIIMVSGFMQNPILLPKQLKNNEEILPPLIAPLGQQLIEPLIVLPPDIHTIPTTNVASVTPGIGISTTSMENTNNTIYKESQNETKHIESTIEKNNDTMIELPLIVDENEQAVNLTTTIDVENINNVTANTTNTKIDEIITTTTLLPTTTTSAELVAISEKAIVPHQLDVKLPTVNDDNEPTNSTITNTTTTETIINPEESVLSTNNTSKLDDNTNANITQPSVTFAPVEYIPNFNEYDPDRDPPPDIYDDENSNSVHEEFSSVVLKNIENTEQQNQFTPNEPPGDQ